MHEKGLRMPLFSQQHARHERRLKHVAAHLCPTSTSGVGTAPSRGLRYTAAAEAEGVLSAEQRLQYERDGFIVVRKLVPAERLRAYTERFLAISRGDVAGAQGRMLVMRDVAIAKSEAIQGEAAITKLQDWQRDPVLFGYCTQPELLRYVRAFTGPSARSIHTMLINKPPDPGTSTSRHPLHQDLYYFPLRPADRIVCAWTAMERVHRGNGCLTVVPGSHTGELLQHEYPEWEGGVNKFYHGIRIDQARLEGRIHVEMEAGDTVFFHPLLIHGSGTNRTQGFRKAISCHYASGTECDFVDVRGTVQEHLLDDIFDLAARKLGMAKSDIDSQVMVDLYHDHWRGKSRHCAGDNPKHWRPSTKLGQFS